MQVRIERESGVLVERAEAEDRGSFIYSCCGLYHITSPTAVSYQEKSMCPSPRLYRYAGGSFIGVRWLFLHQAPMSQAGSREPTAGRHQHGRKQRLRSLVCLPPHSFACVSLCIVSTALGKERSDRAKRLIVYWWRGYQLHNGPNLTW